MSSLTYYRGQEMNPFQLSLQPRQILTALYSIFARQHTYLYAFVQKVLYSTRQNYPYLTEDRIGWDS